MGKVDYERHIDMLLYLTCRMPKEANASTLASHQLLLNFTGK